MVTTIMLFRTVVVVALMMMIRMVVLSVSVGRPRRKRVLEFLPTVRAFGKFRVR